MPLSNKAIQLKTTKIMILELLEKKDEEGEFLWWSIAEICKKINKKSGTVHYHLNPFRKNNLLEIGHPVGEHLVPVYRINPEKYNEYLKLKTQILNKEKRVYKREKLIKKNKSEEMKLNEVKELFEKEKKE